MYIFSQLNILYTLCCWQYSKTCRTQTFCISAFKSFDVEMKCFTAIYLYIFLYLRYKNVGVLPIWITGKI